MWSAISKIFTKNSNNNTGADKEGGDTNLEPLDMESQDSYDTRQVRKNFDRQVVPPRHK